MAKSSNSMIESTTTTEFLNWLKTKLIHRENGIVFDDDFSRIFDTIQNFIVSVDHSLKTPVIYYQAFPEESTREFFSTLAQELASKLGNNVIQPNQTLIEIIEAASLQMVIIDKIQLKPLDTLQNLINFFASRNIAIILVGSRPQIEQAQILSLPSVSQWRQFTSSYYQETVSNLSY